MKKLSYINFKKKVILIIFIIGALSTLIGNGITFYYQVEAVKENFISNTFLQAKLISENCWVPMEFEYPNDAKATLEKLHTIPNIYDAILYTNDDSVYASYHKSNDRVAGISDKLEFQNSHLEGSYLHIKYPVATKDKVYGYLYIRSYINWADIIGNYLKVAFTIIFIMLLIVLFLAYYLQKYLTNPLLKLSKEMLEVGKSKNFSKRLNVVGNDEISRLYSEFNTMLSEIEEREKSLQEALLSLKENETKFRLLAENSTDMISIHSAEGVYLYVSPFCENLLGYQPEELIGRSAFEIIHPEDLLKIEQSRKKVVETPEIELISFRARKNNGEYIWVESNSHSIKNKITGEFIEIQVSSRDITDRKLAEDAVKASEERFRNLYNGVSIALIRTSDSGKIIELNQTTVAMFGYDNKDELIGRDASIMWAKPELRKELLSGSIKDNFFEFDFQLIKKDKSTIWVRNRAQLVKDDQGNLMYFESSILDINERKKAEEALTSKTALLEAQLNSTLDGILVIDENQKRIVVNNRIKDLFNVPIEILENDDDTLLLQHVVGLTKYPDKFINKVMYLYDHPDEISVDEVELNNGVSLLRYSAPVKGEDGKYYGRIWTFTDITEQKQAEEQINMLKLSIDNHYDGAYWIDSNNNFVYINDSGCKVLGYTNEELIGQHITFVSPIAVPELMDTIWSLLRSEGHYVSESIHRKKDGTQFPVELIVNYIQLGGKEYCCGFAHDITERKQAEEALYSEKEFNKTIIQKSPAFFVAIKNDGETILMNNSMLSALGYTLEEVVGKDYLSNIVPEMDRINVAETFNKIVKNKESTVNVNRIMKKDGGYLVCEWHGVPIYYENSFDYFIGVGIDITERQQFENELKQSKANLSALIESTDDLISSVDLNYNALVYNNAMADHFKRSYGTEMQVGSSIWDLMPKDRADLWTSIYDKAIKHGAYRLEYNLPDGRILEMALNPTKQDEEVIGVSAFCKDITERRLKEEAIRESENRLHLATSGGKIGIWDWNVEKNELIWDDSMYSLYGVQPDNFNTAYDAWLSTIHPEDSAYANESIQEALRGEKEYNPEFRIIQPNGSIRTIKSGAQTYRNADGKPIRMIGINIDITEQKAAEVALQKSTAQLKEAQKIAHVGNWEMDLITSDLTWSDEVFEIFEIDKERFEATYEAFFNAIHPEDRDAVSSAFSNSLITGKPYEIYHRLLMQDGRIKYVQEKCKSFYDNSGKAIRSVGTVLDVTEMKEAEEIILKTEKRFRSLVSATSQIVWETNAEGEVVNDMPSWRAFTGQTLEEIKGWGWIDAVHPNDRERTASDWATAVQNKDIYQTEYRIRNYSGDYYYVIAKGVSIIENDAIIAWVGTCTDITERKLAEKEILKLNAELERKVLERTAQLEASNKELEAFSYSVSHDLRAPLRHINGFTELLVDKFNDDLPDKAKQYLNKITDSSHQMGSLIDDLLRFSRIGKSELQKSMVEMSKIVRETIEFLDHENPERIINWDVSQLPDVYSDQSMMKQVWINLLSNAVKYTGTREIANIKIYSEENENSIYYYVQDNGVGFDMQYYDKLFGVFQRLHSVSDFEGTGIGLANVRRIILRHGGQVHADGEIEKGATFYFTLPKNKE